MKESKFIELLNLYVDQQISPEDAALLEEEILRDLRRRKIYSQYCRMHRACGLALKQDQARNQAEEKVVAFAEPRRSHWGYYVAGAAAAACVALVAVQTVFHPGHKIPATSMAAAQPAPEAAKPALASDLIIPVRLNTSGGHPLPITDEYIAQRLRQAPSASRTSHLAVSNADQNRISLPMLVAPALQASPRPSIEDFVFARDPAIPENPKIFRPRQPGDGQEENALEFQRQ
jgi:hypothetical protein